MEKRVVTVEKMTRAHDLLNALCTVRMAFRLIQSGQAELQGPTSEALVRALDHMEELLT